MEENQNDDMPLCLICGEASEELTECTECGLLLCTVCNESHDCDEDDL